MDSNTNNRQILLDTVRQHYASVVWTHKTHEKQADIYSELYNLVQLMDVICAAATSCGAVAVVSNQESAPARIATCILSFGTLFATAILRVYDFKSLEQQHKDAANQFIIVRNELLQIIAYIHMNKKSEKDIQEEFLEIMSRLSAMYSSAPHTSWLALRRATRAIKDNKEYSYIDDEIDDILPPTLRGRLESER